MSLCCSLFFYVLFRENRIVEELGFSSNFVPNRAFAWEGDGVWVGGRFVEGTGGDQATGSFSFGGLLVHE